MPALTREERETVIILNDLGEVTVWSVSPIQTKKLRRRLGPPSRVDNECSWWENLTLETTSLVFPSRKRKKKSLSEEHKKALQKGRRRQQDTLGEENGH
jgi:hypothetical protein